MMKLNFFKMQATGNDFVVMDNRQTRFTLDEIISFTPKLCDRRLGIGSDGILVLNPSKTHDFTMIYRNADGSDAGMCGNGGRAISLFAQILGLGNQLRFQVHNSSYSAVVNGTKIKLKFDSLVCKVEEIFRNEMIIYKVFTGTDHIVVRSTASFLNDLANVRKKGAELRYDASLFPTGTNVNFSCLNEENITLRTYERGVEDLTLACGTGSIAGAIVEHHVNNMTSPSTQNQIMVESLGGMLNVMFSFNADDNTYSDISIEGVAQIVFEGYIEINV
jgi:diaminopimelate epimerase